LRRILKSYFDYYQRSRTHLALSKDAPEARPVPPPEVGPVVERSEVAGLHHQGQAASYLKRQSGRKIRVLSASLRNKGASVKFWQA
jgi:hypothetical protein